MDGDTTIFERDTSAMSTEEGTELKIAQRKVSSGVQKVLLALAKRPFTKNVKIDRRHVLDELGRFMPDIVELRRESFELWKIIEEAVDALPTMGPSPEIILRISISMSELIPTSLPEANVSSAIATLDSADGMLRECALPALEKLPSLQGMAASAGLMVIVQPVPTQINPHTDGRPVGLGSGTNMYSSRNRDPIIEGNYADDRSPVASTGYVQPATSPPPPKLSKCIDGVLVALGVGDVISDFEHHAEASPAVTGAAGTPGTSATPGPSADTAGVALGAGAVAEAVRTSELRYNNQGQLVNPDEIGMDAGQVGTLYPRQEDFQRNFVNIDQAALMQEQLNSPDGSIAAAEVEALNAEYASDAEALGFAFAGYKETLRQIQVGISTALRSHPAGGLQAIETMKANAIQFQRQIDAVLHRNVLTTEEYALMTEEAIQALSAQQNALPAVGGEVAPSVIAAAAAEVVRSTATPEFAALSETAPQLASVEGNTTSGLPAGAATTEILAARQEATSEAVQAAQAQLTENKNSGIAATLDAPNAADASAVETTYVRRDAQLEVAGLQQEQSAAAPSASPELPSQSGTAPLEQRSLALQDGQIQPTEPAPTNQGEAGGATSTRQQEAADAIATNQERSNVATEGRQEGSLNADDVRQEQTSTATDVRQDQSNEATAVRQEQTSTATDVRQGQSNEATAVRQDQAADAVRDRQDQAIEVQTGGEQPPITDNRSVTATTNDDVLEDDEATHAIDGSDGATTLTGSDQQSIAGAPERDQPNLQGNGAAGVQDIGAGDTPSPADELRHAGEISGDPDDSLGGVAGQDVVSRAPGNPVDHIDEINDTLDEAQGRKNDVQRDFQEAGGGIAGDVTSHGVAEVGKNGQPGDASADANEYKPRSDESVGGNTRAADTDGLRRPINGAEGADEIAETQRSADRSGDVVDGTKEYRESQDRDGQLGSTEQGASDHQLTDADRDIPTRPGAQSNDDNDEANKGGQHGDSETGPRTSDSGKVDEDSSVKETAEHVQHAADTLKEAADPDNKGPHQQDADTADTARSHFADSEERPEFEGPRRDVIVDGDDDRPGDTESRPDRTDDALANDDQHTDDLSTHDVDHQSSRPEEQAPDTPRDRRQDIDDTRSTDDNSEGRGTPSSTNLEGVGHATDAADHLTQAVDEIPEDDTPSHEKAPYPVAPQDGAMQPIDGPSSAGTHTPDGATPDYSELREATPDTHAPSLDDASNAPPPPDAPPVSDYAELKDATPDASGRVTSPSDMSPDEATADRPDPFPRLSDAAPSTNTDSQNDLTRVAESTVAAALVAGGQRSISFANKAVGEPMSAPELHTTTALSHPATPPVMDASTSESSASKPRPRTPLVGLPSTKTTTPSVPAPKAITDPKAKTAQKRRTRTAASPATKPSNQKKPLKAVKKTVPAKKLKSASSAGLTSSTNPAPPIPTIIPQLDPK